MTARCRLATAGLALLAALAALAPAAPAAAPTDPQAAGQEPLRVMRVPEALDLAGRPLADVPVLIADTGLDLDHPDIAPRLFSLPAPVPAPNPEGVPGGVGTVAAGASGWDLLGVLAPAPLVPDADPSDPPGGSGHGTLVAGVLGAAWNNGQGGAGVAPNARFVALRTCWDGDRCYQYLQDDAVEWAAANAGVRVVSLSWLAGGRETDLVPSILRHPGILFVTIPSGNGAPFDADPANPYPCSVNAPNVLCVSTSAPDDGLDCGAFGPRTVDVAVPTRNSVTTVNGGGFGPTACATSFASPTAAGVATILFGIDPTATAADVRAAIVDSARPAPAWAGRSVSGGILDAAAAVTLFQQRRGIPPGRGGGGGGGGGAGGGAGSERPAPVDREPPVVRARVANRRLMLRLSEPAQVQLTVQRATRGRLMPWGCRKLTYLNRNRRTCERWSRVGTLVRSSFPAGQSGIRLPPRIRGRGRLKRGSYRFVIVATDAAGNRSAQLEPRFRVVRR